MEALSLIGAIMSRTFYKKLGMLPVAPAIGAVVKASTTVQVMLHVAGGVGVAITVVVAVTEGVGMIVAVGVGVGEENAGVTKFIKKQARKAIHKLKGKFLTFYCLLFVEAH